MISLPIRPPDVATLVVGHVSLRLRTAVVCPIRGHLAGTQRDQSGMTRGTPVVVA
jgi:hypothetical protein